MMALWEDEPLSVVLLAGRTRDDRRRAVAGLERLGPHGRPGFLYLTRATLKARAVERAWWDQPDKPATFLPQVHTIGGWFEELSARLGEGRTQLGPTAQSLLVGRIFRGLRDELTVWGRLPDGPRTRQGLADLAHDWAMAWEGPNEPALPDDPSRFRLSGEGALPEGLRHDAWRFLTAWRAALGRSPGWTDRPGALRAVLRTLRDDPSTLKPRIAGVGTLIVDDLMHLEPLEAALLDAIVDAFEALVPGGTVRLCMETPALLEAAAEANLFLGEGRDTHPTLRATRGLRKRWGRRLEDGDADWELADADPDRLDLADHVALDSIVEPAAAGPVQVRRMGSELAEVRALARELKAEVLAGRAPEDCYVAFPALDRYVPLLRDAFAAYDLPYRIAKGEDLRLSPPVTAARQLLGLADEGPSRERLRSMLGGGWIRFTAVVDRHRLEELGEAALPPGSDRDRLVAALRDVKQGARAASFRRLHRLLLESGADLERPDDPDAWVAPLAAFVLSKGTNSWRLVALAEALADLIPLGALLRRLAGLRECRGVAEVRALFERLLEHCGLGAQELAPSSDAAVQQAREDNRAALARFEELRGEVEASIIAVQATVPGQDGDPLPLYREALDELVHRETWTRPADLRGVHVVGLRDLHGVTVPWLWVGGLVEGEFPRADPPSFLLPGSAARALPRIDTAEEDRSVFASLLRNVGHGAEATLILSWPVTVGGQDKAPSSVLQDLRGLRTADSTLGEHWMALQESLALPDILATDELLTRPRWLDARLDAVPPALHATLDRQRALAGERSDVRGFGRFDGVLGMERPWRGRTLAWLRARLGMDGDTLTLTTTGLEAWVRCPMRFWFERVLELREPEPFTAEPDARQGGILLHKVLETYLGERIEAAAEGLIPRAGLCDLSQSEMEAERAKLAKLVVSVADELLGTRPSPWRDEIVERLLAGLRRDDNYTGRLARFLLQEADGFLNMDPVAVERTIPVLDPAEAAGAFDPEGGEAPTGPAEIRLKGTVDRIDRSPGRAAVWDYKTGRAPPLKGVDRGLLLQPVVYAASVEGGTDGLLSGYRELPEGPDEPRKRVLADGTLLAELKPLGIGRSAMTWDDPLAGAWLRRADFHGQLVAQGVFPPTLAGTDAAGCAHCAFHRACRLDLARADAVADSDGMDSAWPSPLEASKAGA
jgi:ATP-dependent helicase/nuclease subunit B